MIRILPAYIPSPPQGVWHLGPVPIRAYALCIIAGILVALMLTDRRWAARGGERGVVYDIALWAVPFGLIGGRLYHLATDWRTYFGQGGAGLSAALRIWDGGLGIWGAVALGGVGAWIACRRRGIPLPAFGDALAPGLVLAQAIGRLGNYFNQELYGRETAMPWGLEIFYRRDPAGFEDVHSLDGVSTGQLAFVVQPTFLYELIWNVLVFVALIYLDRKLVLGHGRLFATYVAGYCIGRFAVELLRDDTATHIGGIRINSFTSTFVFIGAVVYLILAPKGRDDPADLGGGEVAVELPERELATVAAASPVAVAASTAGADIDADMLLSDEPDSDEDEEVQDGDSSDVDVDTELQDTAEDTAESDVADEPAEPEAVAELVADEGQPAEVEAEPEEPEEPEESEEPKEPKEPEEAEADDLEVAEPEAELVDDEADAADPEPTAPAPTEPESVEPELTEPESVEPELTELEPEVEEPEVEDAEADDLDVAEPAADADITDDAEHGAEDEAEDGAEDEAAEDAVEAAEDAVEAAEDAVEEAAEHDDSPVEPEDAEDAEDAEDEEADVSEAAPGEDPTPEPNSDGPAATAQRRWGFRRRNRR